MQKTPSATKVNKKLFSPNISNPRWPPQNTLQLMDHAISAWDPRVALLVGFRCPHVGSPSSCLQPLFVSIIIISIIIIVITTIIIIIIFTIFGSRCIRYPSSVIHLPSFAIRHPVPFICHPPSVIHLLSSVILHMSSVVSIK